MTPTQRLSPPKKRNWTPAIVRLFVSSAVLSISSLSAAERSPAGTFGDAEKSLYDAIARNDQPAVEEALTAGANLDLPSPKQGLTALVMAIRAGHFDIARYLVEKGADPWLTTTWNDAWIEGNKDAEPYTALDAAARCGSVEMCEFLLFRGTPPREVFDGDGKARRGALYPALQGGSVAVVELLLKHGAKLQPDPLFGSSSLSYAAFRGNPALVDWLLAKGEDPNFRDREGVSIIAKAAQNGEPNVIKSLLKAGAMIDWAEPRKFANVLHICIDVDRPTAFEIFLGQHPPQDALDRALAFVDSLESLEENPGSVHYYNRLIAAGAKPKTPLPIPPPPLEETVSTPTNVKLLSLPKWKGASFLTTPTAKPKVGIIADEGSQNLAALLSSTLSSQSGFELLERIEADKIAREIGLAATSSGSDLSSKAIGLLERCALLVLLRRQKDESADYFLADISAASSGVQIASVMLSPKNLAQNADALRRLIEERRGLLTADPKNLVAFTVLNITSDGENRTEEKLIANLVAHRVSMLDSVVLLDRQNATQLVAEHKSGDGGRFRAGTFLINGRFSGRFSPGQRVEILLEAIEGDGGAVVAKTEISGDGADVAALATRATDDLTAKLLRKPSVSQSQPNPAAEIDRLLEKMRWCKTFGLYEEVAETAGAALALGGTAPRLQADRLNALCTLTRQETAWEAAAIRKRRGAIDDAAINRLIARSMDAFGAIDEHVRSSTSKNAISAIAELDGCLAPFSLFRKESDRIRFSTQIEQARQRFLRLWDLASAKGRPDDLYPWQGIRRDYFGPSCEKLVILGRILCSNDEQYLELLKRAIERFPDLALGLYGQRSRQRGGRAQFDGGVAVLQRLADQMIVSRDPYTHLIGLDLRYRFADDVAQAISAGEEAERFCLDRIEKLRNSKDRNGRLRMFVFATRTEQPLWNRAPRSTWPGWGRIESWDEQQLRNPKLTRLLLDALNQNAGPFTYESTYLKCLQDWMLLGNSARQSRELTSAQQRESKAEFERQASIADSALATSNGRKSLISTIESVRERFVPQPPSAAFPKETAQAPSPTTNAKFVEIGKPISEEILRAVGLPDPNFFGIFSSVAYDGKRFFLQARVYPRYGKGIVLLELDPATRSVQGFPGMPPLSRLDFSGGKLIGQGGSTLWIRESDKVWRPVYKSKNSFSLLHPPALQGDYLAFDRDLQENGKRANASAVTLINLKSSLTEELVNQRRDPKVTELDDLNCKILQLSWEPRGILRVNAKKRVYHPKSQTSSSEPINFSYDTASKKWTKLTAQDQNYRLNDPRFFFNDGIPWMAHYGKDEFDYSKQTFLIYLRPEAKEGSQAREILKPLAVPIHFQQGVGKAILANRSLGETGRNPQISLVCRGGTDWLLWQGSNGAIWVSRYDDFMNQFKNLVPQME